LKVIAAKSAGFCSGVAWAVETAYKAAENGNLVTLGPVIHNRQVTDDLERLGVRIIENLEEWNGETILVRCHGVPLSMELEMQSRGISFIDCTCPWVKRVHHYAAKSKEEGRILIVLGDNMHPEIKGIVSHAATGYRVIKNEWMLASVVPLLDTTERYTLVAQTTLRRSFFDSTVKFFQSRNFDLVVHDTICNATTERQKEAEEISKTVDIMIVLGDIHSANTQKLFEICKHNCAKTFLTQTINDKELQDSFKSGKMVGITAGASTPPSITKEALLVMSDLINNDNTEGMEAANAVEQPKTSNNAQSNVQSFEEMLDESFVTLHTGDVVKGTVIQVTDNEITVNLGYKSDGIITKGEYIDDPNAVLMELVKLGDVIEVQVMRVNDGDGNVLVSKRRLDAQTNYKLIEQAFNEKEAVTGRVMDLVKGGLIASIFGVRVFVPSSQISSRYVEDLSVFKGKEFKFNILEFDRSKRRTVAGRKELAALEQKERREELFATLEVGQQITGAVSRITDFGAFVDLGGVDGLVHISELAWKRVRKVSDMLSVGDEVTVTVIDINSEKNKISLTLKDAGNNPWNNIAEKYPIGSLVEGKVVRMATFGAFVNLEEGIDGLVHISQISSKHVDKPEDELTIGQIVTVKVTDVNEENRKISLSKKAVDSPADEEPAESEEQVKEQSEDSASNEVEIVGEAENVNEAEPNTQVESNEADENKTES